MKTYERKPDPGRPVHRWRGLFLDKGELEQLAAAENAWHAAPVAAAAPSVQPPGYDQRSHDDRLRDDRPRYDDRSHDDRPRYDDRRDSGSYQPRKKKSSFLSDLFEG